MKRLIYYPSFESTNENWLKFALLYVDQLSPILPVRADDKISELYNRLHNETDLLINHRPGFLEGHKASLEAIDQAENIARRPTSYAEILGQVNIVRHWKDVRNQDYILYEEKYSSDWTNFCLENGYGAKVEDGLKLSESLATLYLTILANKVAEEKNISPITDDTKIDMLSSFLRPHISIANNEAENAQAIIKLKLPAKISNISLKDIIKLRNSNGFKIDQDAFHTQLNNYLSGFENGDHSEDFVKKYSSSQSAFTEQFATLSSDMVTIGISTWILSAALNPQAPDYLKVAAAISGVVIKQGFTFKKNWVNTAESRHCRHYLTMLEEMPV